LDPKTAGSLFSTIQRPQIAPLKVKGRKKENKSGGGERKPDPKRWKCSVPKKKRSPRLGRKKGKVKTRLLLLTV